MDVCQVDWPNFFSAIKDLTLTAAAATTAGCAVIGLNKWRDQEASKVKTEAAFGLIRAAVKTRDAINSARVWMIWANEYPDGYNPLGTQQDRAKGLAFALNNRWSYVQAAQEELQVARVQCEAIWGPSVPKAVELLVRVASEWFSAAMYWVQRENTPEANRDKSLDSYQESILFNKRGIDAKNPDPTSIRVAEAMTEIEAVVREPLSHFRQ